MRHSTMKLLLVACEIAGGPRALADRLEISERVLKRLLEEGGELPDSLLLRALDIILADRQSRQPRPGHPAPMTLQKPLHEG
jgi:hypothetical protein